MRKKFILGAALVSALGMGVSNALAGMVLTPAGTSQGFSLSTFVDSFPNSGGGGIGPIGVAFNISNQAVIGDWQTGNMYLAADLDGQHAPSLTITGNLGHGIAGLASLGGNLYGAQQSTNQLIALNFDGSFNHFVPGTFPSITALIADPTSGHLYASTIGFGQILKIDPITGISTVFANASADGLTLSGDGKTLYAEVGGSIIGYSTADGHVVFNSGGIAGGPDGTALGTGALANDLFVNTNGGQLIEIDVTTNAQTLIGNGGSRGDFVVVDPNNDSLLLTQTDSVLRLTAPSGSGFQGAAPLPSTALAGLGLFGALGLVKILWRKRATA